MATPRLGAPELVQNQAVPETTVNETFYWLDAASMGGFRVIDRNLSMPPGSPAQGDCYILASSPTGAWASGAEDDVALYFGTTWEIRTPDDGWEAWVVDEAVKIAFSSGAWGIIGTFDGADYVSTAGDTMTGDLIVPDDAYDATAWNGNLEVPTKNAVRDKIEALAGTIPGAGASTTQPGEQISGFIASPSNKSYTLAVKMAHGGTITETTTVSASGTCTATFKINSTALGGTANSVSSSETSQSHASNNAFSAGDDIVLTVSANSSCADMSFTIKYTRTLA